MTFWRIAIVAAFTFVSASAAWQRVLVSEKGESVDSPTAHPLTYFTADPLLRDDAKEFDRSQQVSVTAEVRPAGKLAGFAIVDVLYRIAKAGEAAGAVKWKSILIQTAPDQYVEIYHLQAYFTTAVLSASRIVRVGKQDVLATYDSDGGNGGGCWEHIWYIDAEGAHSIDFAPLTTAISHRVSPSTFALSCVTPHLSEQWVEASVQQANAECRTCGILGTAKAHFRLRGARVEVTQVEFTPKQ